MEGQEPDFEALARAWVANDSRLSALARDKPEQAEGLVARIAEGLKRRRQAVRETTPPLEENGHLIVNVARDRFDPKSGLDSRALDQLSEMLGELQQEDDPPPPGDPH